MKNLSLLITLIIMYSFNISLAQDNLNPDYADVLKLALECEKGHTESCEKLKYIAKNDLSPFKKVWAIEKITDQNILADIVKNDTHYRSRLAAIKNITNRNVLADVAKNDIGYGNRKAAITRLTNQKKMNINKINDQHFLADIAKNDHDYSLVEAAIEKITDKSILLDFAKNGKNLSTQLIALNNLDEQKYYNQIINIIDQNNENKHNLAAIGALKIIPKDKVLMNSYKVLQIDTKINYRTQEYSHGGKWKSLAYHIKIKTNKYTKSFDFAGTGGGLFESSSDIGKMNYGHININEICELLLSPLSKDDLLKISNESDVVYLRETAKSMLQDQKKN